MGVGGVEGEGAEEELWAIGLELGYQDIIKCVYV